MNFFDQWQEVPDSQAYDNGFKIQWEHFIRHVVENAPYRWTLPEGAKGVQLVEAALQSWKERRWVDVPALDDLRRTMALTLTLPDADGALRDLHAARHERRSGRAPSAALQPHRLLGRARGGRSAAPRSTRGSQCAVDWDATIAYRRRLWSLGLGVAEAMDTAQRGMGLDWPTSLELIRRSLDAARDVPGALVASRLRHRPPRRPTPRRASTT